MSANEEPGIPHRDFLERALTAAGEWSRYADPKLLAVLVLLGLGVKDLLDNARRFLHPHEPETAACGLVGAEGHSCAGLVATTGFVVAAALAVVVVLLLTHGLFPRTKLRGLLKGDEDDGPIKSRFFFGEVARYGSQKAYIGAVRALSEQKLLDDFASQVYEVSKTAAIKHRAAQRAFAVVLAFLTTWALARIALSAVA